MSRVAEQIHIQWAVIAVHEYVDTETLFRKWKST